MDWNSITVSIITLSVKNLDKYKDFRRELQKLNFNKHYQNLNILSGELTRIKNKLHNNLITSEY